MTTPRSPAERDGDGGACTQGKCNTLERRSRARTGLFLNVTVPAGAQLGSAARFALFARLL